MRTRIGASLLVVTCMAGFPALAQDKGIIQGISDEFSKALASGDGKKAASVYTEDATLVPPGEPLVKGQSAIADYWTKLGSGLSDFKLTTQDVQPLGGDFAREIGLYQGTTKDTPAQIFGGKYVVVWKKDGATWKASTDIWNEDR